MIYLDSSVALAYLLAESRQPPPEFWTQRSASSRLLEYEVWNRLHAHGVGQARGAEVRGLLRRVSLVELERPMLSRALQPFSVSVRTLDSLHLATMEFLRAGGQNPELASYDERLKAGARALGIPVLDL